jgi:hypothetical protein
MSYRSYYGANKYGAKKTTTLGRRFDSKFEAGVAEELELRKKGKDILDYDCQYRVELLIYRADGSIAFKKNYKVDFRVHEVDGSFTLLEAKGFETEDYKWKRRLLTEVWLAEHLDYRFEEVRQSRR